MDFATLTKTLNECIGSSEICSANSSGSQSHAECQRSARISIEICRAAITCASWGTPVCKDVLEICAKVCDASNKECSKHNEGHCKNCADASRRAADACRQYAKSSQAGIRQTTYVNA